MGGAQQEADEPAPFEHARDGWRAEGVASDQRGPSWNFHRPYQGWSLGHLRSEGVPASPLCRSGGGFCEDAPETSC